MPFDPLADALIIVVIGAVIACAVIAVIIRATSRKGKKEKTSEKEETPPELRGYPFKTQRSVPAGEATHARDELRILGLEREILGDAIRRLYEAHAEGKITEEERERLAQSYKTRMMLVKDAITKDESLVALHELEAMQEDLMKLFSQRFDELSSKIEELRERTDAKPVKEVTITPKIAEVETDEAGEKTGTEEKAKKKRKPPQEKASPRTEAERRIEEIRSEVEKVLDKLGQMEIES